MSSNNGNGSKKNRGMNRRDFFKWSAAAGAAGTMLDWSVVGPKVAHAADPVMAKSLCPYCSTGCGVVIRGTGGTTVTDIHGDSSHVVNRGGLCAKGSACLHLVNNTRRLGTSDSYWTASRTSGPIVHTGDGSAPTDQADWTDMTWEGAMTAIADDIQAYRKSGGADPDTGENCTGIAFMGSSHMTNEECYLLRKIIANLSTNNTEHQARI